MSKKDEELFESVYNHRGLLRPSDIRVLSMRARLKFIKDNWRELRKRCPRCLNVRMERQADGMSKCPNCGLLRKEVKGKKTK